MAKSKNHKRTAIFFANLLQRKHGVFISPKAEIHHSLQLRHPIGVVIGEGVKIKQNVIIYQNVTLGGKKVGDAKKGNYPTIGDNTIIYAGAVIVGKINIGKNCIIGANSVVTKDVPDNHTAVGAPAKIIIN